MKSKKTSNGRDHQRTHHLRRSSSAVDIRPRNIKRTIPIVKHPLRRTKSTSNLEIQPKKKSAVETIKVDFGFFDRYWRRGPNTRMGNNKKSKTENIFSVKKRNYISDEDLWHNGNEESGLKSPKPILRRTRSFNEHDKDGGKDKEENTDNRKIPRLKAIKHHQQEEPRSPSKETTINGIPLSKLPRQRSKINKRKVQKQKIQKETETTKIEPEKTLEECEKEGARNFARCLLGILPSVLAATEPSVADESLQQFASDVCEAVTCMALKRKNVPNFGNVRKHDILKVNNDESDDRDPSLNADGVYKTVYATLKLSFILNRSGFYKKRGVAVPLGQVSNMYLLL